MKYCFLLIPLLLSSCITTRQLEAEKAFYQLQISQLQAQNKPLFEIVAQDNQKEMVFSNVAAIRVYHPESNKNKAAQYMHRDYSAPWTALAGTALSIGIPAYAAYKTVDSLARNAGSTSMITNSGEGNILTSGSSVVGDAIQTDSSISGSYNPETNHTNTETTTTTNTRTEYIQDDGI